MKNLEELTNKELKKKYLNKKLIIDRETLGFENIENELPNININEYFELPPNIIDKNHFSEIMTRTTPDNKGQWIRAMTRTYQEGGKVLYAKINENKFKVKLIF